MAARRGQLTTIGQFGWGAVGGALPTLVRLLIAGEPTMSIGLPSNLGEFIAYVLGSMIVGAVAGRALPSHRIWLAVYHGGTAPLIFAFGFGLKH